jgi:hypothetical protein
MVVLRMSASEQNCFSKILETEFEERTSSTEK